MARADTPRPRARRIPRAVLLRRVSVEARRADPIRGAVEVSRRRGGRVHGRGRCRLGLGAPGRRQPAAVGTVVVGHGRRRDGRIARRGRPSSPSLPRTHPRGRARQWTPPRRGRDPEASRGRRATRARRASRRRRFPARGPAAVVVLMGSATRRGARRRARRGAPVVDRARCRGGRVSVSATWVGGARAHHRAGRGDAGERDEATTATASFTFTISCHGSMVVLSPDPRRSRGYRQVEAKC